ncbi:MAG TPA: DEAD/DEAH box helicase family protein [Candidatus Saccharimonadales bacterium]
MEKLYTPESRQPSREALELAGALQGVITDIPHRDFQLDLHQEVAFNAIGSGIVGGETAGYIDAATGSGKGMLIALLAEAAARAGQRTLILAPTKQIADQLIGSDGDKGMGRFTDLLEQRAVKQHYGGRRGNNRHLVVVSTYAGFLEEYKAREAGGGRLGEFDLILGDECHPSLYTVISSALYRYMPKAIKVGFSATPEHTKKHQSHEIWGHSWLKRSPEANVGPETATPTLPKQIIQAQTEAPTEAIVGKAATPIDRVVAHWESVLSKEGMPAELPYNIAFTPKLARAVKKASKTLRSETDIDPTLEEIADHLKTTKREQTIVRLFGKRVIGTTEDIPPELMAELQEQTSIEDTVMARAMKNTLEEVLSTLSEREAGALTQRFGADPEAATLGSIGAVYGISPERVRQIINKATSKMRHPSRSNRLHDFINDSNRPVEVLPSSIAKAIGTSTFGEVPDISAHGKKDSRQYSDRLTSEVRSQAANWRQKRQDALEHFINTSLYKAPQNKAEADRMRANILKHEAHYINNQIAFLQTERQRLTANSPFGSISTESVTLSEQVIDIRVRELLSYRDAMRLRIDDST